MLKQFSLLSNLTEKQQEDIEKICEKRLYHQGEIIFQEKEQSDEIYFIVSGKVYLSKIEPETQNDIKFKEMSAQESFGEMSFIDGSPRSCTITAAEDSTLYILNKQKLLDNVLEAQKIINKMATTITHQVNSYLRYLSDNHIATLQAQINELKERTNFGYFFIFLLIIMFITAIVNVCIKEFFSDSVLMTNFFSWSFLIVGFGIPLGLATWKTKLSPQEIGITTKKLKKSVIDGIIFSVIGTISILIIASIIDSIFPKLTLIENFRNMNIDLYSLSYFVHTYIQEILRWSDFRLYIS